MDASPNESVPASEIEDGRHNVWLPPSLQHFEHMNELTLCYTMQDTVVPHHRKLSTIMKMPSLISSLSPH
ncbi:hypothetical protein PISMIDRAFT_14320 [Pisolithus microcarpus 441]|uniref:Uncharacterized protein n=1 Tax=Pisolithus microcarpus 441 TaxID=765257 RepID=A0A0C9ZEU1_9AGAM|nr:hypothetical protein PISMIDRAFT_14320 [Pisolithus microcarpus 441]